MSPTPRTYQIASITIPPDGSIRLDEPIWRSIEPLSIDWFHPASSSHRPQTLARLAHDQHALYAWFHVRDRYVKSLCTHYQDMVCHDSCVELFLQPKIDRGYFNFEFNCGGTMLLYYIEDARKVDGKLARFTPVAPEAATMVRVSSTMPKVVPVEIAEPVDWSIAIQIPFKMLERYVGAIGSVEGQTWRGNLYKCADKTSHPHWASWAPIGKELNFHQPDKFGELRFQLL